VHAKPATPPTPLPQLRKIKQIAPAEKFAWWAAMRPQLKVRLSAKPATPCEDRHLRKINCTLRNALVEKKAAWWVAGCEAAHKSPLLATPE